MKRFEERQNMPCAGPDIHERLATGDRRHGMGFPEFRTEGVFRVSLIDTEVDFHKRGILDGIETEAGSKRPGGIDRARQGAGQDQRNRVAGEIAGNSPGLTVSPFAERDVAAPGIGLAAGGGLSVAYEMNLHRPATRR